MSLHHKLCHVLGGTFDLPHADTHAIVLPHAGERAWRNLLKSDASVDLIHFTILRPPEKQDGTPINELSLIAFPTRELFVDKIKFIRKFLFYKFVGHFKL